MQYARLRGHREEVFAVYAECARRLREELGVEPERATRELLDDVRRVT